MSILLFIILFITSALIWSRKDSTARIMALAALGVVSAVSLIGLINSSGGLLLFQWMMSSFFSIMGFIILLASKELIKYELDDKRVSLYYSIVLALIGSLCGIVTADNLIITYVFLEISAFLSAGIVIIKEGNENYKAAFRYIMMSMLASAIFLIGMVMLYRLAGSWNIEEIRLKIIASSNLKPVVNSILFVFIGLAIKSALFPFHIWLPDAHASAISTSSAILSGLVLKAYIGLFIKLIYGVYHMSVLKMYNISSLILILGVVAMIYGSLMAILQIELKRLIAYSSVAQIGYIFMGIGLGTAMGIQASIFHIFAHGITKTCLFLCAGNIKMKTGSKKIDEMTGLASSLPITMALYTICGLSMIGIPLLVGFSSKWNYGQAILNSGNIWVLIILSISSLLNGLYFLPITIRGYFSLDESRNRIPKLENSIYDHMPIIILGMGVVILGIFSSPLLNMINNIVRI